MTEHDRSATTTEATEDPIAAWLSDLGETMRAWGDLLTEAWPEPEVEHVEAELARPFFDDDEVLVDKRIPAVVVAADPDINGCVCVRVLDGTKFWGWRTDQLVVLHPRRLSRPDEVKPGPTVAVRLPDDADLVIDMDALARGDENVPGKLIMPLEMAERFARHVGWAIEDAVAPF